MAGVYLADFYPGAWLPPTIAAGGALLGRYYALANRNITALTDIKSGATPLVLGTDYTVDLVRGRIYILPTGGVTAGEPLTADYTFATWSYTAIAIATQGTIDGYLRYVSNNIKGTNYDGEWWHVSFIPSGQLGLIADDYGAFTIEGECIADAVNHPTSPIGNLIAVS